MKRADLNKKDLLLFTEFAAVIACLLLPPLFSAVPFSLPPKPEGLYAQSVFCFYTLCAAAYEEVLYRLYTPNRLHRIYAGYIKPRLQKNPPAAECSAHLPQSSLPHNRFCYKKTAVSKAAAVFEFFLTEFPAVLLFTLAHRYFAAGAGTVFRIAYLKLKQVFYPAVSIALAAIMHGLWNIGVYYYLWGHSVTV